MKVNTANQPVMQKNNRYAKSAGRGALITAGALTASTAFSWASDSVYMKKVVQDVGGKSNYMKTFALGMGMASAAGALTSMLSTFIISKIVPKKPPKAI